jgi:phage shock protein PspC (stress-responsive transcriptional regulator)
MIGGVIGGLSEILPFEADPTILRVCVAVIATVTCFLPLTLAYLVCWVIIPKEPLTK